MSDTDEVLDANATVSAEPMPEEAGDAGGTEAEAHERDDVEEGPDSPEISSNSEATAVSGGARQPVERDVLEREGEIAADFIESLLDICDLDGDLDVDVDGDRAVVSLVDSDEGRVPRRLVGTDGQVLDALQELTRLAVYAESGQRSRLMLDIAGHRAKRREVLVNQAQEAIDTVLGGAEQAELPPMSAFERKVVHDAVLAAGLVSESAGTEPRRYVVVYPAAS
ncbi:MAG: protein jag [Nostocoides sp.]